MAAERWELRAWHAPEAAGGSCPRRREPVSLPGTRRPAPPTSGTYRLAAEIDGVQAASPTFRVVAAASQSASGEGRAPRTLVVLLVLLAIPLLAVAALPGRLVPGSRAAELLAAGRLGLTAAGFAALAAASALYVATGL